ncbi:MAG: hypothetical protein JXA57_05570 [Armatimonadetes bacterium]|nr:hypothetical protein [Armatimonadota bacterium]
MSNEEIAVRLAAAVIQPSVVLPSRRANITDSEDMIRKAAELAVSVYRTMLEVIEQPQSS